MEELWLDIKEYEGMYQVSNLGNVKSLGRRCATRYVRERILKAGITRGYTLVVLMKDNIRHPIKVHRLVMENFIPQENARFLQVNHKNGIKHDNRLVNLEWVTSKENLEHAIATGLTNRVGEANPKARLNSEDILNIRKELKNGRSLSDLAKQHLVGVACISKIKEGRTWKHI